MRKFPMILQLALILFCVMAIPLVIVTWFSGAQIVRNSEEAIAESSLAGLNASQMLNENALNNIAQNTVRFASAGTFDRIRSIESYVKLNAEYQNVRNANTILNELVTLNQSIDGIYSSFFYLNDADYVVSSDKGIIKLANYESIDWMGQALQERIGIQGVWYPRMNGAGIHIISFIFPLNSLSTATQGTIVINLKESQVEKYLNTSNFGNQNYWLMKANGIIISQTDKQLLLTNGNEDPELQSILEQQSTEGYEVREVDHNRLMYVWSRSNELGWINVSKYSVDELMRNTHILQKKIIVLNLVILFLGSILTVIVATWLSNPVRKLVRTVRERVHLGDGSRTNELAFLEKAFRRMQEDEEELHRLLDEKEHDVQKAAIQNLLRGEVTREIEDIFQAPYYLVVVASIDRYREYMNRTNPETRKYHRYALISQYDGLFPYDVITRCVYQGDGQFVMIINFNQELYADNGKVIAAILGIIKQQAVKTLEHSVTIGVSRCSDDIGTVPNQLAEAMEAIKQRMVAGSGCILHWKNEMAQSTKYIYPANREMRILNFIDNRSLHQIKEELDSIRNEIQTAEHVSFDNILFIYNQLAGATIKHLRENNVNTTRIFTKRGSIYAALASCDTLSEIEEHLYSFYSEIIKYFTSASESKESNHGERIVHYLNENYYKDIVFEEMAKEIGISYSYMRKIAYEMTGLSLVDYLNKLRIDKAKDMLMDSGQTIAQIASEVGYYNVRSLNHYFRKFEGMPPSSFKAAKMNGIKPID
ncbi:helix-turn-helix domain-containing protein [Paenibacillus sp. PR3]|uniref:Helix-turn-helix domain-containing protein n=1 Tax=Paenibacillus terricola TaxID=2763503 RepID=A0ABR8N0Q4_9BACL|nr:AraC family transcriptional regulator [Paenibacillus terricola]MBD3921774.1 helix-turn-helix domain-containing protein [Paenibacillus terricola]